jgi:hypothetical protein
MRQCAGILTGILVFATVSLAQGIVDQSNDPTTDRSFSCGDPSIGNGTLGQGFRPALTPLVAVQLRLKAGGSFPTGGTTTTARILAPDGSVLGESTASVAGPQDAGTQILVRFDFDPIEVETGADHRIEWVSPSPSVLTWTGTSGGTGGTDSYANGVAYSCVGSAWPVANTDFNFVTWAAEEETAARGADGIEVLRAMVRALAEEDRISGRTARVLERLLDAAQRALDRDQPRAAIAALHAFHWQVRVGILLRRIPLDAGRELLSATVHVIESIRSEMGARPRFAGWWARWTQRT